LNGRHIDFREASPIHATLLGSDNALGLPLTPQVCLEFGKDTEHIKEGLSRGVLGIHWLLCCG
jgi:hypothetical protein